MGKIKGWKKVKDKEAVWLNGKYIDLTIYNITTINGHFKQVWVSDYSSLGITHKSKLYYSIEQAKAYAMKYMKSHPNG